ncbi:MAG: aspartate aminotransferase family protein [Minwuia sp.]|uniref:aspartate aminotransferase family protein n=1 Tax=Minwuia sp. TaxID=2493630 RepID=UPI003A8BEF5B
MNHVFLRHTKTSPPVAVAGDGCWLIDSEGKRYLDGSGGAAVSCLGHSDRKVIEAVKAQMDALAFAHTGFFTSEAAEAVADRLAAEAPGDLDRVFLVSGGSEAVEAAIKMARQYFIEIGQPGRHHVIARWQSYHGNTLGALSAGGNRSRRALYEPLLVNMSHISPCYAYRLREEGESEADFGRRVADELDAEIRRLGPESVAAFIAEPVVGATLGAVPAVEGYFRRIREICDEHGVLFISDEVMCGMGRCGALFTSAQEGVTPDIIAVAKGLGAGYQPIGATICSSRIYEAFAAGSGFFQHGHTYMGHPAAAAAAGAVLSRLIDDGLVDDVQSKGEKFAAALTDRFGQHPHIGDIRGRGLLRGLEIVQDRETKTPFDPALGINGRVKKLAQQAGLICYPGGGTVDGRLGDHVLLAPAFIISDDEIAFLVDMLATSIDRAIQAAQDAA